MTAHARNAELLERVMQHIDDHPEAHDQRQWVTKCGTAACFAGWACQLTGQRLVRDGAAIYATGAYGAMSVRVAAEEALGLSVAEADVLFAAYNTRDELRLMVKDLVNGDDLRECDDYAREAGGLA